MKSILTLLLISFLAGSCGNAGRFDQEEGGISNKSSISDNLKEESFDEDGTGRTHERQEVDSERKIIKEGNIRFETSDAEQARAHIDATIKELDGYISKDNVYTYGGRVTYELNVRVPAEHFDKLLNEITNEVGSLDSKSIDVLDVTEDYIDVKARLKTKKELEQRYLGLLKKANTVSEVLNIEREMATLRAEIESVEGRLKYLIDKVQFSTLNIEFYEPLQQQFGFGKKFINAIKRGWDFMLLFLIGITHMWPFALLAILLVYGIKKYLKFRKRKKAENS